MMGFRRVVLAAVVGGALAPAALSAQAAAAADAAARIDSVFAAFGPRAPGCAVEAVRDGRPVFQRSYGLANLELGVPITPKSAFYAASVSKQFTAFAVALLVREGKLSLDDDIRKWIPEVPDFGTRITVAHLLHHTSGLRDYFELLWLVGWPLDGPLTESQFLDLVGRQKALNFEPGTRFLYSNTGYVLLSVLVRRASGQSLRDFAAERIFRPLGMSSTAFRADHAELVPNRAEAYGPRPGGGWSLSVPGFDVVGDGGLYTTVEDLARWDANFYDRAVGGSEAADIVLTRAKLASGVEIPYAGGIAWGEYRGQKTLEHGGAYAGYRTEVLRFRDLHFSVLTLCNTSSAAPAALSRRVADILLGDRLGPLPVARAAPPAQARVSGDQLARLAGAYWSAESQSFRRFAVRDSVLAVTAGGEWTGLRSVGPNRFAPQVGALAYAFAAGKGAATRVTEVDPAGDSTAYTAMEEWRPDSAQLRSFAGVYHSDELDTTLRISTADHSLMLMRPGLGPTRLETGFRDAFTVSGGLLRFERAADGGVSAFTLSAGRVKGLRFERER